ncbi:MAG: hypothetical protein EOO09_11180 [Chitinophagaceae bacterium]|nr:MAG: hypothetical protein EOO09_11180 [Chitinophagaceae bacterium]
MKKILYILTLSLIAVACNSEEKKAGDTPAADSVNSPVINSMDNPNRTPGSNTPGEGMGNGDTSSYEGMSNSNKTDSTRH